MANIKPLGDVVEKWQRVTPNRQTDYDAGIAAPRRSWATASGAAADAYAEGVQAAIARGGYAKGVSAAGDDKWARKTQDLGSTRWGPGVRAATSDYEAGFAPYHSTISRTTLPTRYSSGSPQNIERVRVIAEALHQQKVRTGGS